MDKSACSSRSIGRSTKAPSAPRHYWTPQEENTLINSLKSLRVAGWKCNGSFKSGYILRLENMLAENLQVWKKAYGHILGILRSSGGGGATMDPTTHMIIAESDVVWEEYIKFDSWVKIFGNDCAQGTGAIDVGDVVAKMLYGSQANEACNEGEDLSGRYANKDNEDDMFDEAISNSPPHANTPQAKSSTSSKQRRLEASGSEVESMMGTWLDRTSSTLADLITMLKETSNPSPVSVDSNSSDRKALFKALGEIPGLSLDNQIIVGHRLVNSKGYMDMFWGMHDETRARFVSMLVNGRLDP
ncbi:hypothetical protein CDL12_03809 [Handroanthus impetiginosus]|uniref:Myb/SANT-like domain-containing protein n=1 Tax=Handroanthus impetiginosus TaxID=429701 RepID=A0A2G9I142_9LAMI|nr:hypothetical protein CDL12_03809 [Handroanthus impetiginosus]